MERISTRLAAATIAGAAVFGTTAPPANATVFEQFTWEFSDEGSFDDCGFTITSDYTARGTTVIRTVRRTETLFYASISQHSEEVLTNAETGEWFRITSNAVFKEGGPISEVSPGVYTYTVREPGNLATIWDSSGRKVASENGLVVSRVTFDTGGDDVPGGEQLDWQVVSVRGPHPLADVDFCDLAGDLIG